MATDAQDLVVHASIALKWFVPETDSADALELRDQHIEGRLSLYAPVLLIYELANALRYRSDLAESDIQSGVEALFLLDMELMSPSSKSIAKVILKARQFGITLYDAVYMQLAEDAGCELITADHKLYKKVQSTRIAALLKDY